MIDDQDTELGPAMEALTDMQRLFVRALMDQSRNHGKVSYSGAAKAAGYKNSHVAGHVVSHKPAVQAAILEESKKQINLAAAMIATPIVAQIAMDEDQPAKERLRACEMLLNRGGMAVQTEHKVTVEHKQPRQMLELASRLAAELGVDPVKLIGVNQAMKPILDGDYTEISDDRREASDVETDAPERPQVDDRQIA